MKIATILHGKTGDLYSRDVKHSYINNDSEYDTEYGSEYTLNRGYLSYKDNFPSTTDFFIHSWSTALKERIIEIYRPLNYIIEPQIKFNVPKSEYGHLKGSFTRFQNTKSRIYSLLKGIELYYEHCSKFNLEHDWIVLGRFDLVFCAPVNFESLSKNKVYISTWYDGERNIHWMQKIQDFWMIVDNNSLQKLYKTLSTNLDKLLLDSQTKIGPSAHYIFRDLLLETGVNVDQMLYYNSQDIPSSSYSLVRDLIE